MRIGPAAEAYENGRAWAEGGVAGFGVSGAFAVRARSPAAAPTTSPTSAALRVVILAFLSHYQARAQTPCMPPFAPTASNAGSPTAPQQPCAGPGWGKGFRTLLGASAGATE